MPNVTGTLSDIGMSSLAGMNAVIRFTPSENAVSPGGRIFASKPVDTTPIGGSNFAVNLASTVDLSPRDVYWKIAILFANPDGYGAGSGYTQIDLPEWQVRVPTGGGTLASMLNTPAPVNSLWVGLTPPSPAAGYRFWVDLSTNPVSIKEDR